MAITSCCPVRCYWSWIFVSAALASSCDGCHRLMPTLTPRVLPLIAAAKMLNQTYLTVSTNTRREKEDANRCTFFRRRNVSLKVMPTNTISDATLDFTHPSPKQKRSYLENVLEFHQSPVSCLRPIIHSSPAPFWGTSKIVECFL